jgi:hypothetical protein
VAGPAGDICDLYAFPSPEVPDHLVLIMDLYPRAAAGAVFSEAIVCRFRLRPVTVADARARAPFAVGSEEIRFETTFDAPRGGADVRSRVQEGRCTSSLGGAVDVIVDAAKGGSTPGLRVFAGLRSDPFFIDLPALQQSLAAGRLAFGRNPANSLSGFDVLSVVVETDCAPVLKTGGPLFAVVAETVVAGQIPIRLERVGRPEIKNVIMSYKEFDQVNRDIELRDLYNLEDAFHLGKDYRGAYRARLNANLAAFDRLDGRIDWPLDADGAHPLTDLLLADHLVVDLSKPYAEDGFLEIERSVLAGHSHRTCGGRSPNEDVMETLYTLLINGGSGPRISDGVRAATRPATQMFPYLAPPNLGPTAEKGRQP